MLVSETSGYEYVNSLPRQVDPTPAQWEKLIAAIKKQNLVPILDNAYQGYASGDLVKDGKSVFLFEKAGMEFLITQSFAKNFGLYGERIGYLHVMCADKDRAAAVLSQIKLVVPSPRARVVHEKVHARRCARDERAAQLERE